MPLQIDEDTAVGATTLESEIVHAQYPSNRQIREGEGADPRKQGIAADVYAEMMEESCPRLPTEGKRYMGEPVIEFASVTRIGGNEGGETLGEGTTRAARIDTEESAYMEMQGGDHGFESRTRYQFRFPIG